MKAEIAAGINWQMVTSRELGPADRFVVNDPEGLFFKNSGQNALVHVTADEKKVRIPAPFGVKPTDATGEGVVVSQLRDEEGGDPQEFLHLPQPGTWVEFFGNQEADKFKVVAKE